MKRFFLFKKKLKPMAQFLGPVFPRAWKAHLLKCREDSSNSREKDEKMCLNTVESTVPLSYVHRGLSSIVEETELMPALPSTMGNNSRSHKG